MLSIGEEGGCTEALFNDLIIMCAHISYLHEKHRIAVCLVNLTLTIAAYVGQLCVPCKGEKEPRALSSLWAKV